MLCPANIVVEISIAIANADIINRMGIEETTDISGIKLWILENLVLIHLQVY